MNRMPRAHHRAWAPAPRTTLPCRPDTSGRDGHAPSVPPRATPRRDQPVPVRQLHAGRQPEAQVRRDRRHPRASDAEEPRRRAQVLALLRGPLHRCAHPDARCRAQGRSGPRRHRPGSGVLRGHGGSPGLTSAPVRSAAGGGEQRGGDGLGREADAVQHLSTRTMVEELTRQAEEIDGCFDSVVSQRFHDV